MKRYYVKPHIIYEEFIANEYVSACVETKKHFLCDGPYGQLYVFWNSNGDGMLENKEKFILNEYGIPTDWNSYEQREFGGCGYTLEDDHIVDISTTRFYDGFVNTTSTPVIVHIGKDGRYHATTKLKKSEWHTNVSG